MPGRELYSILMRFARVYHIVRLPRLAGAGMLSSKRQLTCLKLRDARTKWNRT
jgi:hypothetical protein